MKREAHSTLISEWRAGLDAALEGLPGMQAHEAHGSSLPQAARYVVSAGGKRLRGLMTCCVWSDLCAQKARADLRRPLAAAVAIEALHAASLVHDDLPALDNDDLRRGKPSCHKAFDEATAILTADALFGSAMLSVTSESALSSDEQARVSKIVSRAWLDLCMGQQLDVAQQRSDKAVASHERVMMVRLKTGALFGAAAASGALCAGVRDAAIDQFTQWGVRVGECFQALDDLDDGDRLESDRADVHAECQKVKQALVDLDQRLAEGVTPTLLDSILGEQST